MFPHGISNRRLRLTLSSVLLGVCLLGFVASGAVALPRAPRSILELGDPDHIPWNASGSRVSRTTDIVCTPWNAAGSWATEMVSGISETRNAPGRVAERSENSPERGWAWTTFPHTLGPDMSSFWFAMRAWLLSCVIVQ
jgi:hypothetical protein